LVHDVIVKEERRILRCGLTPEAVRRCLEVPDWMFDRAACCVLRLREEPRVDRAALERLKSLIAGAGLADGSAMIEAGHRPSPRQGDADATPGARPSHRSTGFVSPDLPGTGLATPAGGGARKGDASNGAPPARAPAAESV